MHSKQLLSYSTTHVTGTRLHLALRYLGVAVANLTSGLPEGDQAPIFRCLRLLVTTAAAQFIHVALCLIVIEWWDLGSRRPTTFDLIAGLVASVGLVAAFTAALPSLGGMIVMIAVFTAALL